MEDSTFHDNEILEWGKEVAETIENKDKKPYISHLTLKITGTNTKLATYSMLLSLVNQTKDLTRACDFKMEDFDIIVSRTGGYDD